MRWCKFSCILNGADDIAVDVAGNAPYVGAADVALVCAENYLAGATDMALVVVGNLPCTDAVDVALVGAENLSRAGAAPWP